MFRGACVRLLLSASAIGLFASSAQAQWSTADLVDQASALLGSIKIELKTLNQIPHGFIVDPTEQTSCFIRQGEGLRYFQAGNSSLVVLAGNDSETSTVMLYFSPPEMVEATGGFDFIGSLLGYMFPTWTKTETWPQQSFNRVWETALKASVDPTISLEEKIVRHSESIGAVAVQAGLSVITEFRATARHECEKISPFLLASPRQFIKDAAHRRENRDNAWIKLTYVHPIPIDVSKTPIFLGSTNTRDRSSGTDMEFDLLPTRVELGTWINSQVQNQQYSSTTEAVRDGWPYRDEIVELIRDPSVPVERNGEQGLLVVNSFNAQVVRILNMGFSYSRSRAEAVLFAGSKRNLPAVQPDRIDFGGSYLVDLTAPPLAVDVTATPLYLGYAMGPYGADGYYTVTTTGMTVQISDRATGGNVSLDLEAWANFQPALEGNPGTRIIEDPVVPFKLNGKSHILVLAHLALDRSEGGEIQRLVGHIFAER